VIKARHILETVLYAEDLSATRRFYGEVLGLPVYQEVDKRLVFFRCAGQMLLVFNPSLSAAQISPSGPPAHGTKGNGHVCFRSTLSELDDWQKHFDARGIAIERIVDWPDGGRSIYVRDPAGNSVEFAESRIWDLAELKSLRDRKIVVATHNQGKLREINELLSPHGVTAVSASSLGFDEPEETEATFTGNAKLKAVYSAERSGLVALADDSGLCVDALNGDPGVYTANWAGPNRDWAMAMRLVEEKLQALGAKTPEKRKANFNCTLCVAWPHGEVQFFEGRVHGHLTWPPRGTRGFGYDPMFVPDGETETFGEMDPAKKILMSHRGRAFERLVDGLL
jgi:XTP/dITP diphosphohydrolase